MMKLIIAIVLLCMGPIGWCILLAWWLWPSGDSASGKSFFDKLGDVANSARSFRGMDDKDKH